LILLKSRIPPLGTSFLRHLRVLGRVLTDRGGYRGGETLRGSRRDGLFQPNKIRPRSEFWGIFRPLGLIFDQGSLSDFRPPPLWLNDFRHARMIFDRWGSQTFPPYDVHGTSLPAGTELVGYSALVHSLKVEAPLRSFSVASARHVKGGTRSKGSGGFTTAATSRRLRSPVTLPSLYVTRISTLPSSNGSSWPFQSRPSLNTSKPNRQVQRHGALGSFTRSFLGNG